MAFDPIKPLIHREPNLVENLVRRSSAAGQKGSSGRVDELRRAAQEFESLFIFQMLKVMRETVPEGGLLQGGPGNDIFLTMMDQHLASAMAEQGGLGLAEIIVRDLEPALGAHRSPAEGFTAPLEGRISSPFGMRIHPILDQPDHHNGVDIAAPAGAEISAVADGRVVFSGSMPKYGNVVVVEHAGGLSTLYAHNEANVVQINQRVSRGQIIARVGSTGRVTGPHLHFELHREGAPVNPLGVMVAMRDFTQNG